MAHAAFEFHRIGPCLNEQPGVRNGLFGGVVSVNGEVGDNWGALGAPCNGAGVVEHFRHGDVRGVRVAEDDHAQGVAYEEAVNARFVEEPRGRVVVGRQHRDFVAACFGGEERFEAGVHGRCAIVARGRAGRPARSSATVFSVPGRIKPGRRSASGCRTKRRAVSRGWGRLSSSLWSVRFPA